MGNQNVLIPTLPVPLITMISNAINTTFELEILA